ncbi:MAG: ADOP family duplicated permease [Gemmatimonadota bacterium]
MTFEGLAVGVYRVLLLLLPGSFRREHGEDSVALFRRTLRDARAEGGRRGAWRAARSGWVGVLRGAGEEVVEAVSGGPASGGSDRRRGRAMTGSAVVQAWRSVARSPGVTAGVVGLLGLGIGATVTVLSVVDGVLVRALPYPEPERLAVVTEAAHSWPDFLDWRETVPAFETLAAASGQTLTLTDDRPVEVEGARVSDGFFRLLGARVVRGRLPSEDEFLEGSAVAVLGHAAWERRWGGDPGLIGRTISVDGRPVEVIGMLSADFLPPAALTGPAVDLWVPVDPGDPDLDRHDRSFAVVGRLADGATLDEAADQLAARAEAFAREFPDTYAEADGSPVRTFPPVTLREATSGEARGPLLVLLAGAALLLLVACGNAASLLLARGTARRGELAVRRAMGGGRGAILGQLLAEAGILGVGAGAVGLALARGGLELLRAFEPGDLPRLGEVALDVRVVAVAVAVAVTTGVLAGLLPAWRGARVAPAAALRRAGEGTRGRTAAGRGRWLVAVEAALASLLLVGSLAVVRGFGSLVATDPGFRPEGAWAVSVNVGRDVPEEQRGSDARRIRERLAAVPGVEAVGAGFAVPFEVSGGRRCCWLGELLYAEREIERIWVHPVTSGYFQALGARFRSGGGFEPSDRSGGEGAFPAIINARAARELFGSADPTGEPVRFASLEMRVLGVVEDLRTWGADQPVEPELYIPYDPRGTWASGLTFAVRGRSLPPLTALREIVGEVAPRAVVSEVRPLEAVMAASLARQRFYTLVLGVFAGCALALAGAGLCGSLLYDVRRRRHEMGVRMALGAPAGGLVRRVVLGGLGTVSLGAVVGLAAFWPLRRHLEGVVPGAGPGSPWVVAGFAAILAAVALLASWLPARLVSRTDPARALR